MTKRFIDSIVLKLFMRFVHYVIMLPVFQADTVASSIVQFRKFIYQEQQENKNLRGLHKQKHRKSNIVLSLDMKTEKRS